MSLKRSKVYSGTIGLLLNNVKQKNQGLPLIIQLELLMSLMAGGFFLFLLFYSEDILLEELSKAFLIIICLSFIAILNQNSHNSKQ